MSKNIIYKENLYDLSNYKYNYSQSELKILEKHKAKQELIDKVRKDYKNRTPIKAIEEKYDLHFKTVKRYLSYDSIRTATIKNTELDSYSSIIYGLIKEDLNLHQIYTEIKARGYSSSYEIFSSTLK